MAPPSTHWDLAVVGAGSAGAAAALGALRADPGLRVALLDRADFPRDKACGDAVAPHALDLLAQVGVTGLVHDRTPVGRIRLGRGGLTAERRTARPAWVVPRRVLDARLVDAAVAAGAHLLRHRVRELRQHTGAVVLDGEVSAAAVVGADGAHSAVRRSLGLPRGPMALALRGYAPVAPGRRGVQVIEFGTRHQLSVRLVLRPRRRPRERRIRRGPRHRPYGSAPCPAARTARGAAARGGRGRAAVGRAPSAAVDRALAPSGQARCCSPATPPYLVNPLTGEGIYYAVATGIAAGRAAAAALRDG
ncbi:FAD-dependent monooxygenase [Streptomyces radiopugnans]|nr:FAD-dependent monooxygenase [Streptomyces radiopugnans]